MFNSLVNLFQDGEYRKKSLPVFLPATSRDIGTRPQTFLMFGFNLSYALASSFKAISSASLKLLNLNQENPLKKSSKSSGQIFENNFAHKNARAIKLWSHDHICNIF